MTGEGIGEFLKLAPGVEWLIEKPLRIAVLYEMATRAMKNPERLCYLSKNEYRKFSLKRSQWNQIERVLHDLETGNKRATFVQRTGRVDDETGAIEYRLVDNIFIDTSKTNKKTQQAGHEQLTGNKRAQTKEKSIYNKKEIIKKKDPAQGVWIGTQTQPPKVSPPPQRDVHIDLIEIARDNPELQLQLLELGAFN